MSSQSQKYQAPSWIHWVWVVMGGLILSACSRGGTDMASEQVDVQLKWVHQAQFAGFYMAQAERYYGEENLNVNFVPGGPHLTPATIIDNLVEGETEFAIVGGDQLLAARFRGEPVVAIAVIFQKNPYVYASLQGSGIQRPQDLRGKEVMVPQDAEVQHQALMKKLGVDTESIEHIPYVRNAAPLVSGEIDAHMVYRTALGLVFEETGEELNWIWVDDYGVHFYADTLVASETFIQQNPELVERFLRASIKGWRYAIEHPDQAVDLTLQYDPDLFRDRQARMMEAQMPLIHTGEAQLGWMERRVWEGMWEILIQQHDLAAGDIDEAFTMQFLSEIYENSE